MNIKIMSHNDAIKEVKAHSKKYNVVFITNPDDPFYRPEMHDLVLHGKKTLVCKFVDIEFERDDRLNPFIMDLDNGPQKPHIEAILEFIKDKDDLLVCCHAGCSRSSATAFVILCSQIEPKEAIKILEQKHDPNRLVVKYGSQILNKPEMITLIDEWKTEKIKALYT